MPEGLSWGELSAPVSSALQVGGADGWSVAVYTDLGPERHAAERIVVFLADLTSGAAIDWWK